MCVCEREGFTFQKLEQLLQMGLRLQFSSCLDHRGAKKMEGVSLPPCPTNQAPSFATSTGNSCRTCGVSPLPRHTISLPAPSLPPPPPSASLHSPLPTVPLASELRHPCSRRLGSLGLTFEKRQAQDTRRQLHGGTAPTRSFCVRSRQQDGEKQPVEE